MTRTMVQDNGFFRTTLSVVLVVFAITTASATFCGKLGSFDALCIRNDTVFIISFSPCHESIIKLQLDRIVYLTVIDIRGEIKKYDFTVEKPITKPLSYGRGDIGILLGMHYHSGGSKKGHLHVDLALGNFSDNGIHTRKTILDVYFFIENAGFCFGGFSVASFYPSPACQISKRTGNLSTLCISKPSFSTDKKSQGIFFISMDPCTSPMSYWVMAFFPTRKIAPVIERFTASKTNSFVPVESGTCGFKVKYSHKGDMNVAVAIQLLYGCNDATAVQMINDYYFPDATSTCPHAKCIYLTPRRRQCFSNMIVGRQESVNLTFDISLSGCDEEYAVSAVVTMDGAPHKLYLDFKNQSQMLDFQFDGINRTQLMTQVLEPITSGYIPKFGGYINVMYEHFHLSYDDIGALEPEHYDVKTAFLIIERFYGQVNSASGIVAPLVYEEFSLPQCMSTASSNRGHASLSSAVKAIIALSIIAVVAVIIGYVIYRRRNRGKSSDGLPYQIELNYDNEDEGDYRDDL